MTNNEITFSLKKTIGVINNYPTGWNKEVNLISWNNGAAKIDIRDWDPDHMHMSKGITLRNEEGKKLLELLSAYYSGLEMQEAVAKAKEEEPALEKSEEEELQERTEEEE